MSDLDLRTLEREALDDPAAGERLAAAWRRLHGFYRCPACGRYVPVPHWDDHEAACKEARDLVADDAMYAAVPHIRPIGWPPGGDEFRVGGVARAQPFYDREFVVPGCVQTSLFVSNTMFVWHMGGQKYWGSDTNMVGAQALMGSHLFLVTGISVVPDASAHRESLLWLRDRGSVQLRRSQCDVVTLPGRLALSDQPEVELEDAGGRIPLSEAMGRPGRLVFDQQMIVSITVGGRPVVLDNAFRVEVNVPDTSGITEPFGVMAVLWGIWIAGIPG